MYWMVSLNYNGIATIAIETKDNKKPTMNDFRRHLQMQEVDLGIPIFKTQNPEIESIDEDMYKRIKKFMNKKTKIENLANNIIKIAASLSGIQQEKIIQFLESDPQMSFQQVAKFLAPKIKVNESIIYSFLMTHDHPLPRENDYLKRN